VHFDDVSSNRETEKNKMRPSLAILIAAAACAAPLASRAQIKAYGYDTPSYIEFGAPRFEVSGMETNAVVTVVRNGDFRNLAAVDYTTKDGTAEGAVNFHPCGGTLTFAPGESFKTINIPIIRDEPEPAKTFQVEMTAATVETIVITPTAEVEIQSPPPALTITGAGKKIAISWADLGEAFELEALVDGVWGKVANVPMLVNGEWSVQLSPAPEAPVALFRLKLQE
jgi:hypothetical protein